MLILSWLGMSCGQGSFMVVAIVERSEAPHGERERKKVSA
jgi:hypothetical protein